MSYSSLNLIEGDNLTATHIRHMEAGMRELDSQIDTMRTTLRNILADKGIVKPANTSFNDLYLAVTSLSAPPVPAYTSTGSVLDIRTGITSGTIKLVACDLNSGVAGFKIAAYSGVKINWGDGSAEQTVTTAWNSWTHVTHSYTIGSGTAWSAPNTQFVVTIKPLVTNGITGWGRHDTGAYRNTILAYASQDVEYRLNANDMFSTSKNLEYIHISGGSYMQTGTNFSLSNWCVDCSKLKSVYCPVMYWNGVNSIYYMFSNCSQLTTLQMGATWDTINCTNADHTFYNCSSITAIPAIDTSLVTDAHDMFCNCSALTTIAGTYSLPACTTIAEIFANCGSLTTVPALKNLYNVKSCTSAYKGCASLVNLPTAQTSFDTETCTNFIYMFYGCTALEEMVSIDFSAATAVFEMFYGCTSLYILPATMNFPVLVGTVIGYTDNSAREGLDTFFYGCTSMTTAPTITAPLCLNAYEMFANCTALVNVPDINLPECIRAHEMFINCTSMINAPHHLNLPKVQNVRDMFSGCSSLRNAPEYEATDTLSLPEALYAYNMFLNCTSLVNGPHAIVLNKATHVYSMFQACAQMSNPPVSVNAPAAQQAYNMFYGCTALVNPPSITMASAISVSQMFYYCQNMVVCPTLNLPAAQNLSGMFRYCTGLTSTIPYTFNSATNLNEMFYGCNSLKVLEKIQVGGTGCTINSFCYDGSSTLITGYWPEPTATGSMTWNTWIYTVPSNSTFKGFSNSLDCAGSSSIVSEMFGYTYLTHIDLKNFSGALSVTGKAYLTSVRLYAPKSSIGNITLNNNALDATALDQLFTDLPTVPSPRTINVRANPGALTCTTSIATAKNWVVTTV